MQSENWLLSAMEEMEAYAKENNLNGFVEGLGRVLEIYASEAILPAQERLAITEKLRK